LALVAVLTSCGGSSQASDRLIPLSTSGSHHRAHRASRSNVGSTSSSTASGSAGVTTTSGAESTHHASATSTTTTSTLPAIPGVDPALESTVWSAYLDAVHTIDAVAVDPDPDAPSLAQHLTNRQLELWQDRLQDFASKGETANYPPHSQHRWRLYGMTVKYPNWVDLDVCYIDDAVVTVRATGKVVDNKVYTVQSTETMWLQGSTWRLAGRVGSYVEASQCPGP
jgi:hypothetical protein